MSLSIQRERIQLRVRTLVCVAVFLLSWCACAAEAQTKCGEHQGRAEGRVVDPTGALVVHATLKVHGLILHTDEDGRFITPCMADGRYAATIEAPGFANAIVRIEVRTESHPEQVRMQVATVTTEVNVATNSTGVNKEDIAGSLTLNEKDLSQLADDPDELSRQLQVLAAAAGGAPGQAIVTVNGFQNSGQIPPKSSIAFIRVNPDLFSAEYARPPYRGGRIEIYTKPGQSNLHGALFTTQSAPWVNARDPFAPSKAALGKQRYGFELSGPIVKDHSDFALALEHRQIAEFAVVDAVTLDAVGLQQIVSENEAAPQSLWEGSARFGFLPNAKNNLTISYTANVNVLGNQGVGGDVLTDAGYNSLQAEHVLQLSDLETISANLLHETRFGYTWRYRDDAPNSTAPSLQVAGAFTGGGVITGPMHTHERDLEFDDDVLYSNGKHNMKAGLQLLDNSLHDTQPSGFNGTYLFGGGPAPALNGSGSTETITGLEQYRRALLGLPGGTPTQFDMTLGSPQVALNQLQAVLYVQDQWKLKQRLQLSMGLRWAMQNAPVTVGNVAPRLGVAWSPDRRQKTVFHARTGLFFGVVDPQVVLGNYELNGTIQRQVQIDSPVYGNPLTTGTSEVTTVRTPLPALTQSPSLQSHLGVEHDFPEHWHVQANFYLVHGWDGLRSRNINSPLNGSPAGPRPLEPNVNLLQFQQTGRLGGNVIFIGVDQHSLRKVQIFAGYIRMDLRGDDDSDTLFPQRSTSDQGEIARPSWLATHQLIAFSNYVLPHAVNLSIQFNAASGVPYNVTTGFDNNGDGVFNDRPVFVAPNTPGSYDTRFGWLSPTGLGTSIGRDAGTLPWNVHLDTNLSHTFTLSHREGKAAQTLFANVRSTNLLNHTNVLAVGGVLGSPLFGQAYQADEGRRIEAGLRWSF